MKNLLVHALDPDREIAGAVRQLLAVEVAALDPNTLHEQARHS